jgi:hypothetical protein
MEHEKCVHSLYVVGTISLCLRKETRPVSEKSQTKDNVQRQCSNGCKYNSLHISQRLFHTFTRWNIYSSKFVSPMLSAFPPFEMNHPSYMRRLFHIMQCSIFVCYIHLFPLTLGSILFCFCFSSVWNKVPQRYLQRSRSWPLKMGQIINPETSVRNYYYSLRRSPEQHSSHPFRGGSLKSRKIT